jgi:hypothetical protein
MTAEMHGRCTVAEQRVSDGKHTSSALFVIMMHRVCGQSSARRLTSGASFREKSRRDIVDSVQRSALICPARVLG